MSSGSYGAGVTSTVVAYTLRGRPRSAAALERERDYHAWLTNQPEPERDVPCEASWQAFMKQRRARQEKLRLRRIEDFRTAERRAEQLQPTMVQRQDDFAQWLQAQPDGIADGAEAPFNVFLRERREQREQQRRAQHQSRCALPRCGTA